MPRPPRRNAATEPYPRGFGLARVSPGHRRQAPRHFVPEGRINGGRHGQNTARTREKRQTGHSPKGSRRGQGSSSIIQGRHEQARGLEHTPRSDDIPRRAQPNRGEQVLHKRQAGGHPRTAAASSPKGLRRPGAHKSARHVHGRHHADSNIAMPSSHRGSARTRSNPVQKDTKIQLGVA